MTEVFAHDTSSLNFLSEKDHTYGTPASALVVNLILCLIIAVVVDCSADSIDQLLNFTAGVVWIFFALVVVSVFVFRKRYSVQKIPYKIPWYPFTPIIFLIMCGYMLWGALDYKPKEVLAGIGIFLLGLPFYYLTYRNQKSEA